MRYEDLLAEGARGVAELADFLLGPAASPPARRALVDAARARSSVEAMRAAEARAGTPLDTQSGKPGHAGDVRVVRGGEAGGWRKCFGARDDPGGARARAAFAESGGDAMLVRLGYLRQGEEW